MKLSVGLFTSFLLLVPSALAQIDARMLRQPAVSATQIAFVYAGDIWLVSKEGGVAHRLSSPPGEESFPRFSPDGRKVAFTGNYDGNQDVYVVPVTGGTPERITHHPMQDRMVDWYPDGEHLLYASPMFSGRKRYSKLFKTAVTGGLPDQLPLEYGEFGAVSPDGRTLAFMIKSRQFRTWKRYRGGWASDIHLFDFESHEFRNLTDSPANDASPMWHGRKLYFLSDRSASERFNIWVHDLDEESVRQVTHFDEFDIHFPSIGPSDIVFEAGGRLYLLDLSTEETREVKVEAVTDLSTLRTKVENVARLVSNASISPSGKRVLFEARGDVFSVPAEHGPVLSLTRTSGVAERYPEWSPDGRHAAYWSDASGEYELYLHPADGSGAPRRMTSLGAGFRYRPYWSPDSKKIAFIDEAMTIRLLDIDSEEVVEVDRGELMAHSALNNFEVSWSPDSRWMAFSRMSSAQNSAIYLYDARERRRHQVTAGFSGDFRPVFDPDGKYLFLLTNRHYSPSYSDVDNSWIYANATQIAAVTLRNDVPSLLEPRNDEEKEEKKGEEGDEDKNTEESGEGTQAENEQSEEKKAKESSSERKPPEPVEIDLDGFETRMEILPMTPGNYGRLEAASGKLIFHRQARTGSPEDSKNPLLFYDLKEREEKTILEDADAYRLSFDGKKILVRKERRFAIVDAAANQKLEKTLAVQDLEATVDPRAEWRQIFHDAWRFQRDYFYDAGMHGVDWEAMKIRYGRLLEDAVTRWDVNFVLGELIGELNASHTYRGGGDAEQSRERKVGLLGIDWSLENGAFRIQNILRGAEWDVETRSPLDRPGLNVKEGDYILAINGVPMDVSRDPWASLAGLAERTVELTVNDRPSMEGARRILVKTLEDDTDLRFAAWIEANRRYVEELSGGRVGYIYVQSTGIDGQSDLVRQFQGQWRKEALLIDERFNSGGQIPDRFVELLDREALSYWAGRQGRLFHSPPVGHLGPKAMLINGWSGSGGDAFPYYFREKGLGPLIGTRTWGGLIGISGSPSLVDGGTVTVPTFRMYSADGEWFPEGYGVEPDFEVPEDPVLTARGEDPQLKAAVEHLLRDLESNPPRRPEPPPAEIRVP